MDSLYLSEAGPPSRPESMRAFAERQGDAVVSASAMEGTPFALLEAAWGQRPGVATPVGDTRWIVGDGGLVTGDLAAGLRALRDPGRRAELGALAATEVRRRFPVDAVAPRLRALYTGTP